MTKLRVNRFDNRMAEILYFIIERRLKLVYCIVGETEEELKYYPVNICAFWSSLMNTTKFEMAANPIGECYETGEPSTAKKDWLMNGIFANELDITKNQDEVYYILTNKRKKAFYNNVIG